MGNEVPVAAAEKEAEKIQMVVAATPSPVPAPTACSSPIPVQDESEEFWNRATAGKDGEPFPGCGDSVITHPVVDPDDATPSFFVEDVYPHSHMVYWGTRRLYDRETPPAGVARSEQVQLFAPADIHSMEV